MNSSNVNAAQGAGKTEQRNNPGHPAWKLPPHVAYQATDEERREMRRQFREGAVAREAAEKMAAQQVLQPRRPGSTAPAVDPAKTANAQVREAPRKSLDQIKAEAAQAVQKAYARHGSDFSIRVKPLDQWTTEAKTIQSREGCDLLEAMYRAGFVHAYISLPQVPGRY